ncbi:hypothetical protein SDC9_126272 [bioreactor metagenome]|uniref:Uncharacterized protein n=1 Tax=bioreactor metagenome TaxID=1076179 RepID=A0A645CQR6_9ZZZZ
MTKSGAEGQHPANSPLLQQLPCLLMGTGKPLVLVDHQFFAAAFCRGHHGFALFQRNGHGFFTQHMLTGSKRLYGNLCMGVVGGAHAHRVNCGVCQQGLHRFIGLAAKFFGEPLCAGHIEIRIPCQCHIGVCKVFRDMSFLRNSAASNDADLHHIAHPF